MKRITRTILSLLLGLATIGGMQAQTRPGGTNGTAARGTVSARPSSGRPTGTNATRPAAASRPSTGTQSRPGGNQGVRPGGNQQGHQPGGNQGVRPGGNQQGHQPGGNQGVRPGGNQQGHQPGGNQGVRPGGNQQGHQPGGNQGVRPGNTDVNRPGSSSAFRPGWGTPNRPVGPSTPAYRPGSSVSRPGGWNPVTPPHNNWANAGYRPPRPGGGYWGAPTPSRFRIGFWAPPMPPRYSYAVVGVPTLGTVLGLTFGSFIDAGINSLYNAGYQVAGYADNVIYLTNVNQLGLLWPEVAMQYTGGLLSNSQFSFYTAYPSMGRFNTTYQQLCMTYGQPVSNTGSTVTWWAGDNTGYITLHYAYMNSLQGVPGYYTTLTYSAYY